MPRPPEPKAPEHVPHAHNRWVTFDCYGTLIDWKSGFTAILRPISGEKTRDLLHSYHAFERQIESERPHRLYKDVLAEALTHAAREVGVHLSASQARALQIQWASMPVFEDIPDALATLHSAGWKLAVLTNCDADLFAQTQQAFSQPFDLVVTAEQVRDYKPSLTHFRHFEDATGVRRSDWVHVACSWFHDIAPARQLGIRRIWLDRDGTGEDPSTASLRLVTAAELPGAIDQLCGEEPRRKKPQPPV